MLTADVEHNFVRAAQRKLSEVDAGWLSAKIGELEAEGRATLEEEGYEAQGAATGREGVVRARQIMPDLVLLDVNLPDMNGLEVLEALRGQDSTLPVIMVSAMSDTRLAVKAVKAGASDYVTKPFELDELLMLIRTCLQRERLSAELEFRRRGAVAHEGIVGTSPSIRVRSPTVQLPRPAGAAAGAVTTAPLVRRRRRVRLGTAPRVQGRTRSPSPR